MSALIKCVASARMREIPKRTGEFIEVISDVIRLEIVIGVFVVDEGDFGFARRVIQNVPQQEVIVSKNHWRLDLIDSYV